MRVEIQYLQMEIQYLFQAELRVIIKEFCKQKEEKTK